MNNIGPTLRKNLIEMFVEAGGNEKAIIDIEKTVVRLTTPPHGTYETGAYLYTIIYKNPKPLVKKHWFYGNQDDEGNYWMPQLKMVFSSGSVLEHVINKI